MRTPSQTGYSRLDSWRAKFRKDSGQTIIETSVALAAVMLIVFGVIELSLFVYTYSVMNDAAREGVRYAIVHGTTAATANCSGPSCTDSTGTNVVTAVKTYAAMSAHDISAINVSVGYPDSSAAPLSRVTVTVTYTYVPIINLSIFAKTMQVTSQGRIVN